MIKQFYEVGKVSTGYGDDYTTGCLLGYAYFKDNYKLIAFDLSKQKSSDADPRAIQQIVFQRVVGGANGTKIRLYNWTNTWTKQCLNFPKELQKFYN